MFWNEHDLAELKGTSLVGQFFTIYFAGIFPWWIVGLIEKLGRADAEHTYKEKLLPVIEVGPFICAIK